MARVAAVGAAVLFFPFSFLFTLLELEIVAKIYNSSDATEKFWFYYF